MKGPLDIHRELLAVGVPHEIVRLQSAIQAADELPVALALPPSSCVSVRMYDADGVLHALAVPAAAPTRAITLARALGARRLELAPASRINAVTGFRAGLVSPVGLPVEVVLVVDAVLGNSDVLYAATGDSGTVLKIRSRDLLLHTGALVAALTAPAVVGADLIRLPVEVTALTERRSAQRVVLHAG